MKNKIVLQLKSDDVKDDQVGHALASELELAAKLVQDAASRITKVTLFLNLKQKNYFIHLFMSSRTYV